MVHERHLDLDVDLVDLDSGEAVHRGVSKYGSQPYFSYDASACRLYH